jgi:hypothetical protein
MSYFAGYGCQRFTRVRISRMHLSKGAAHVRLRFLHTPGETRSFGGAKTGYPG